MTSSAQPIPEFRPDGYLPDGLYLAPEAHVIFRFGSSSARDGGGWLFNCTAGGSWHEPRKLEDSWLTVAS